MRSKVIYKLLIILVLIGISALTYSISNSFAAVDVTKPATNMTMSIKQYGPDYGFPSTPGLFCVEKGQALDWDATYKCTKIVTATSEDGVAWHILGYLSDKDTWINGNHNHYDNDGHLVNSQAYPVQAAVWKTVKSYSLHKYFGSNTTSSCNYCMSNGGSDLINAAKKDYNNGEYYYKVTIYVYESGANQTLIRVKAEKYNKTKPVTFTLQKQDTQGKAVENVKVNVTWTDFENIKTFEGLGGTASTEWYLTSNKSGKFVGSTVSGLSLGTLKITPNENKPGKLTLHLTETKVPTAYMSFGTVDINIEFNDGKITKMESSNPLVKCDGKNATITLINQSSMNLHLIKKEAFDSKLVSGAEFEVTTENVKSYSPNNKTIKTGADGTLDIKDIIPQDGKDIVSITLKETKAPQGLAPIDPVTITWKKDSATGEFKLQTTTTTVEGVTISNNEKENRVEIVAVDKNVITKLEIIKIDSSSGKLLNGAKFDVEIEGAKFDKKEVEATNGKIVLENIVLNGKEAVLKLTETKAPDNPEDGSYYYEKVDKTVYYKLKYEEYGKDLVVEGPFVKDESGAYVQGKVVQGSCTREISTMLSTTVNKYSLTVNFKNIPLMDLEGQVWLDGDHGVKKVEGPNGKKESNELRLEGVNVYINGEGIDLPEGMNPITKTDKDGKYSFKGLESPHDKNGAGYVITFEYNGIEYNDTIKGGDSKAFEANNKDTFTREQLNQRFTTITKDGSNDGTPLQYKITESGEIAVADLEGDIDGTNPASAEKNFKVRAKTNPYNKTTKAVDFGMVKRFFDLKIDMVINNARLTINDKETTYDYEQTIAADEYKNNNNTDQRETIDLKLYDSDYRYRIDDYRKFVDIMSEEDLEDKTAIINQNTDINKQLRVFVTYEVAIMNQSYIHSKVNELAYYYQNGYKFVSAVDEAGNKIEFVDDNTLPKIEGKTSARVKLGNNAKDLGEDDYRQVLYFTFEIVRDENGALPKEIENGMKFANIVEILSYSTTGGFVDDDSCPGNSTEQKLWEDDTFGAKALNVIVDTGRVRTIEGIVWDDTTKDNNENGKYDEGETKVDDVIVQLIEIKNIPDANGNKAYREAIWQETTSGKNNVKIRNNVTGVADGKYNNGVNENGKYKFTGFIPGDYIVRFIYGDGIYRIFYYDNGTLTRKDNIDNKVLENIKKYNGQDFQSTKDLTLDANNKTSEYKDKENAQAISVARDNEARRLQVMSYSTVIDKQKGEDLENKTDEMLSNTWMTSETSRIVINIDGESNNGEPTIVTALTPSLQFTGSTIKFNNVNLGLLQRPQTKLLLEKHITGLKITPVGVGINPIVDAKVKDIDKMIDTGKVTTEGVNSKLKTIMATRSERGFWELETDVEELTQSAPLNVEYTFVIKNESEADYLSKELVTKYKELTENNGNYAKYLTDLAKEARKDDKATGFTDKQVGKYLGNYYYKRTVGNNDQEVLSRVETINDYINNDLKYISENTKEGYSGADFLKQNSEIVNKKYYNVHGEERENGIDVNTVITNATPTVFLKTGSNDHEKKVVLTMTLDINALQNEGINIPAYLGEIVKYTNAAGRRDMEARPENLEYAHSEATDMTLDSYRYIADSDGKITYTSNYEALSEKEKKTAERINEVDEFWGETIKISKPTGQDKLLPVQIILITIGSLAAVGISIFAIKKYALKK